MTFANQAAYCFEILPGYIDYDCWSSLTASKHIAAEPASNRAQSLETCPTNVCQSVQADVRPGSLLLPSGGANLWSAGELSIGSPGLKLTATVPGFSYREGGRSLNAVDGPRKRNNRLCSAMRQSRCGCGGLRCSKPRICLNEPKCLMIMPGERTIRFHIALPRNGGSLQSLGG